MEGTHCEVTLAIHDMNGFAPLGSAPASVFDATPATDRPTMKDTTVYHSFLLDLCDGDDQIDAKEIDIATAVALTGISEDQIVQIGRQRLCQIEDEAAAI